mmetsp:Transcript_10754/g.14941  ORF Transcript_10754/g.14941 Transcript_10754/m.14941 type:complete len:185 (-) Transcript_10754:897-1451(-)
MSLYQVPCSASDPFLKTVRTLVRILSWNLSPCVESKVVGALAEEQSEQSESMSGLEAERMWFHLTKNRGNFEGRHVGSHLPKKLGTNTVSLDPHKRVIHHRENGKEEKKLCLEKIRKLKIRPRWSFALRTTQTWMVLQVLRCCIGRLKETSTALKSNAKTRFLWTRKLSRFTTTLLRSIITHSV